MLKRAWLILSFVVLVTTTSAANIEVGASGNEVVAAWGAPKSKMTIGGREILGYPDKRVVLINGKVTAIEPVRPEPVSTAPSTPRKPTPAPAAKKVVAQRRATTDVWRTDFAAAQGEATASNRRLLVLFTGSDWCPPCMQFESEVAHAPAFLNATSASFVLVKLDYPRRTPQPADVRARNEELRRQYGVKSYPTLMVINPDGKKGALVDTQRQREVATIQEFFVQAVQEAASAKDKSSFWPW